MIPIYALTLNAATTAITSPVGEVIGWVEVLVGGIFGLYLLMFFLNIYRITTTRKMMNRMRDDMKKMDRKIDTLLAHMGIYIKDEIEEKKIINSISADIKRVKNKFIARRRNRKKE